MSIQAIETIYNSYRFRSRLEARWAVFFDKAGIRYEYEKEGYDLDGTWYLPDFWLPDHNLWVEIKGERPSKEECNKAILLAMHSEWSVVVSWGEIDIPYLDNYVFQPTESGVCLRKEMVWTECPLCHKIDLAYCGAIHDLPCGCPNYQSSRLISAYTAARQARFEYGERGKS